MADLQPDDLADELARMNSDNDPAASPPLQPSPEPLRPASARPVAKPLASAAPPKPPIVPPPPPPRTERPAAPSLGSASPSPRNPRPVAPALVSSPGVPRKERPATPTVRQVTIAPTDLEADGDLPTGLTAQASGSDLIDVDDPATATALQASDYHPKVKSVAERRAAVARNRNLEFRRTLIPILLTCGLLMGMAGMWRFFLGSDSMLAGLPIWIPIVLLTTSGILLALAIVNMLSVKQQLAAKG